ncbi:MAG: hypothetical protein ACOC1K_01770 [Nanoarchaeota archaeon]
MADIFKYLSESGNIIVNKDLAFKIGLYETILIFELYTIKTKFEQKNALKNEWFHCSVCHLEEQTTLGKKQQKEALKNLEELNLISVKQKDKDSERFIKINEQELLRTMFT